MSLDALRRDWLARGRFRPAHDTMTIGEDGLMLGATVLAKMAEGSAPPELSIDGAEERILALLGAAYGSPIDPDVIGNIRRAAAQWRQGEKTVALIHLAMTGLPKLESEEDFYRLFLADGLLDAGLAPRDLMTMLRRACGKRHPLPSAGIVRDRNVRA